MGNNYFEKHMELEAILDHLHNKNFVREDYDSYGLNKVINQNIWLIKLGLKSKLVSESEISELVDGELPIYSERFYGLKRLFCGSGFEIYIDKKNKSLKKRKLWINSVISGYDPRDNIHRNIVMDA